MIMNTSKGRRWTLVLGAAAVTVATLGIATPAEAYWRHGWGWGPRVGIGFGFYPYYGYGYPGYPGYVYAPPVAYVPPPPPPPTYYSRSSITSTTRTTTHHSTVKHHVSHKAASCPAPQSDSHANETLNSDGSYTPNAVQQTNPSAPQQSSPAQDGKPPTY